MATMRLTATVATAVSTSTTASDRVDRSTDHTFDGSTIRTAVTMSTPARAASGIRATNDPATSTTARRVIECTTADRRVRAPARALTAVRAMAPVEGIPPNIAEASEARPWPTSSRSGSLGRPSVRASATLADRRDSMAARTATASAAEASCGMRPSAGRWGTGRDDGSAPMRRTVQPPTPATTVATITPRRDAGRARWRRGSPTITTATMATSASASRWGRRPSGSPTARRPRPSRYLPA